MPDHSKTKEEVITQIADAEPFSMGIYADRFEAWTGDQVEALRKDCIETATEEELLDEIERRRRAGLLS